MSKATKKCPDCGVAMKANATKCPACGTKMPATTEGKQPMPMKKPAVVIAIGVGKKPVKGSKKPRKVTAYMNFSQEVRADIKTQHPDMTLDNYLGARVLTVRTLRS